MHEVIFHLALASAWNDAQRDGRYRESTRGKSLAEVGFIHASMRAQILKVAAAFYADETEALVLLMINPVRLEDAGIELRMEPAIPSDPQSELFPHIYGELPIYAVEAQWPAEMVDGAIVVGQGPFDMGF